jgi:hypothetical protein
MESARFQLFLLIGTKLGRFSAAAKLTLLSGSKKHGGDQRNPRTDRIPQGRRTRHLRVRVSLPRRLLRPAAHVDRADVGPAAVAAATGQDLGPRVVAASACAERVRLGQ